MIEVLADNFALIVANWERALVGGVMAVSAVIFLMGLIKKVIKKIPNTKLRRFALAFGSIVLVLPVTAGVFAIQQINYNHYWVGVALNAVLTIVGYWLYEYTCCRDLISVIGKNTVGKILQIVISAITKKHANTEIQELIPLPTQPATKAETKKVDYTDLNNL